MAEFCSRWHLLGHRCVCGYLPVPARFYTEFKGEKQVEVSHGEAEAAYLAWLGQHMEDVNINPPVKAELLHRPVTHGPVTQGKACEVCNKPFMARGKVCNACRQRAYRERK